VEVFLAGGVTCTTSTALLLEYPPAGHTFLGRARFSGWAASPHGIASVDLWFNNRRLHHRARITTLPAQPCPGPRPVRFDEQFAEPPRGIWPETDVQLEVTDGWGRKTVFDDRWISFK